MNDHRHIAIQCALENCPQPAIGWFAIDDTDLVGTIREAQVQHAVRAHGLSYLAARLALEEEVPVAQTIREVEAARAHFAEHHGPHGNVGRHN
jgi:hypothetical protein